MSMTFGYPVRKYGQLVSELFRIHFVPSSDHDSAFFRLMFIN